MAIGDEIYEEVANKERTKTKDKRLLKELLDYIDSKPNHTKDELKSKMLELIIKGN